MTGETPEELGNLASLRYLYLNNNQLTGETPEELGNLARLRYLYLRSNQLTGAIPEELGNLNQLFVARFAGNALTGCVPNGLRRLVTASNVYSLPAQDFIAVDANGDGDTSDDGDTPGLGLPFCTLRSLTLSGVTLAPAFASDTVAYTASATLDVLSTTVMVGLYNNSDTVAIMKGADTYMSGDPVPLNVGENVITIKVTPADSTPVHTYEVTINVTTTTTATAAATATATATATTSSGSRGGEEEEAAAALPQRQHQHRALRLRRHRPLPDRSSPARLPLSSAWPQRWFLRALPWALTAAETCQAAST